MKILHTADWHVGRTVKGRSRAGEHRAVLAEIAGIAAAERVDLVLVAGDIFDSPAPTAEAEEIVYRALLDLAAVAPVRAVAGNHDHPQRLQAVAPLLELGSVKVATGFRNATEGGVADMKVASGEAVRLVLLPFLSQRYVVRADQLMSEQREEHNQTYSDRVGRLLAHLCDGLPSEVVAIAVSHLTLVNARLGGGERPAHTFLDYVVPATVFPGRLNYVALGHMHRLQKMPASAPTWYAGSPLQLDFGEEEDQKGVLLVEASPSTPAMVQPVWLSQGRPMRTLRGSLDALEAMAESAPDAHLRILVEGPPTPGLAERVRAWFPEAVSISVAAAAPGPRPNSDQPRLGRPPRELFAEYLESKGATDQRVLGLFDELMEEAVAAGAP